MNNQKIKLHDIPEEFNIKIPKKLVDYSVALGRVRNNDPRTFRILGSGTLVQKAGKYGILTAHHCLHDINPELTLGTLNSDVLVCVIKRNQTVIIKNYEISEQPLAGPANRRYGQDGPDITFINIPNGPRLSTFKAVSSFWNLDADANKVNEEFVIHGDILVNSGFPEEDYKIETVNNLIFSKVRLMVFISDMSDCHIEDIDGWDYIKSDCNYTRAQGLPRSFAGLSGGGIWSIKLKFNETTKEWDIHDFALIGMTFYESPIENDARFLRGHFVESIYNRAWNNS
jgi:hypothetical protein